jgi:hypothetical protein
MVWTLELRREAANYMIDSWPYLWELRQAISLLRNTPHAIPPEGATQLEPGLILWETANHLLLYERIEHRRKIIIWTIKPQA